MMGEMGVGEPREERDAVKDGQPPSTFGTIGVLLGAGGPGLDHK